MASQSSYPTDPQRYLFGEALVDREGYTTLYLLLPAMPFQSWFQWLRFGIWRGFYECRDIFASLSANVNVI
jgi:hypothetical protein